MNQLSQADERIMSLGCWIWLRAVGSHGYANGRTATIHTAAWREVFGDTDLELHHLCGEKLCYNPRHLIPVGNLAHQYLHNNSAVQNASKTHCLRGHPFNKQNTYLSKGWRRCRRCHADRMSSKRKP